MGQERMDAEIRALKMAWVVTVVLNVFALFIALFMAWTAHRYTQLQEERMKAIETLLLTPTR